MFKKLNHWIREQLHPDNTWIPFALALAIRFAWFIAFHFLTIGTALPIDLGRFEYDTRSYLDPIDQWLISGDYQPDFRMPGYGMPYLMFRLLFERGGAVSCMMLAQLVLSAWSCVLIARAAFAMNGSLKTYRLMLLVMSICPFIAVFDYKVLTESFTTSALIIGICMALDPRGSVTPRQALVAGLFLGWAVFLRPITLPVLVIIAFAVLLRERNRAACVRAALLLAPFLVADGAWMLRNWRVHERIAPLTTSVYYPQLMNSPFPSVHAMVQELGGSDEFWREDSEAYLLGLRRDIDSTRSDPWADEPAFPTYAYTSRFQEADLRAISDSVSAWRYAIGDTVARQVLQQWIALQSGSYVASFKEEHPWDHLIGSRLRSFRRFIFHSGMDRELPDPVSFASRSAKALLTFLYVTMLLCGCVASVRALLSVRQEPFWAVAALVFAYGLMVHPFIFRIIEGRYLAPFIPWCLLVSFVLFQRALKRLPPRHR